MSVSGIVELRPLNQRRTDRNTGEIELIVDKLVILNRQTGMKLPSYKNFGSVGILWCCYLFIPVRVDLVEIA